MNAEWSQALLPMMERVGWGIVQSCWLGAICAILLALTLRFTRSAAARHLACMLALVATLVSTVVIAAQRSISSTQRRSATATKEFVSPAGLPFQVPAKETSRLQPAPGSEENVTLDQRITNRRLMDPVSGFPAPAPSRSAAIVVFFRSPHFIAPVLPWLTMSWLMGVVFLSLRHFAGWRRIRAWRRSGRQIAHAPSQRLASEIGRKLHLRLVVPIMESAEVLAPVVVGTMRPIVLLPLRLISGFRPIELEAILAHELAHIARGDTWANLLQMVCETALFYHPAVWWMSRRARIERENAADDLATAVCTDRLQYATALARLAEEAASPRLVLAANDGVLLARIRRLLVPNSQETNNGWATGGLMLGALVCATFLVIDNSSKAGIDESAPIKLVAGQSIQSAIDAAPAGAVIQLAEGEWHERIVISKPLTLEGAGWEKTHLRPDRLPPGATEKGKVEFRERYVRGLSSAESAALDREWTERFARPTVLVRGSRNVVVRNLRIGGVAPASGQAAGGEALVVFDKAHGAMSECAIVGPGEDGIEIHGDSEVEIARSLVAALRGQAVIVEGGSAARPPSRLHLVESEIRAAASGVQIGRDCDTTVIDGCRIWGLRGDGIRYEESSPTILGNAIFNNGESGIHAHGRTRAKVQGNLFWKNKMHGMACWFGNADTIEGNTFVENGCAAVLAMGDSTPAATQNIFAGSPVGITCGTVGARIAQPALVTNLFWQTGTALSAMDENKPAPEGSLSADPRFRDPLKGDFTLLASSPAIAAGIGALQPLAPATTWRTLPEESALAFSGRQTLETGEKGFPEVTMALGQGPQFLQSRIGTQNLSFDWFTDGDARQSGRNAFTGADLLETRWLKRSGQFLVAQGEGVLSRTTATPSQPPAEPARKPAVDAKRWLEDAFQLEDKAKREAAIERIRQAMTNGNADEARAAVTAFVQLAAIEFDKVSFRPAVRALLNSTDAPTRAAAASAFTMTGADAADLERILALADDSAAEVRDRLTGIIVALTKGDLTGKPASDAILKLMNNLPRDSRSVAHAMWGVKFSPEIEARVLEFCRDIPAAGNSIVGYNFFYGALSTQANKSEASCRRLIELLAHQDTTNIAGRSAWGLQQGVAREQFPLVADAMVKVIEARSDGYLRNNALRCLRTYGDARQVPALKAFLAKPGVSGEFRKQLDETVGSLERRVAETGEQPTGTAANGPPAVAKASQVATPSSPPAAAAPAPEKPEIEVEWRGRWWPARVLGKDGETTLIHYVGFGSEWDETVPANRVRPIQVQNTQQSAVVTPDAGLVEQNRRAARLRAAEDRRNYSPEQLQEIETLYQVANTKGKRTPEAKASLKQLLEKYDKANRTGCATLYLGQASEGAERLEYLTRAVEKFSDCYYFNGCQVGGYGRYVLALTLWEKGEKEKALSLLAELKTKYKDATDHSGRPMGQVAEAVEKELAKQK